METGIFSCDIDGFFFVAFWYIHPNFLMISTATY